ncbi:hypothetical protein ACFVKB_45195 [Rhodococcus sp. NPDC127530]|uniref:hypothetical protein n=1 Tax=unclassified Rhodococcus (in: high G+C Gram-positive bacteria) TaxID=192944 RepID=UPI003639B4C7
MAVEWVTSAEKHGIDHEDALHAIENAVYVEQEFDEPRVPGTPSPGCSSVPRGHWVGRCSKLWR